MSEEDVERVRRAYEASAKGDMAAVVSNWSPDIEWVPPKHSPSAGTTLRGVEAALADMSAFTEAFESYEYTPREFIPVAQGVLVLGHHRAVGRGSGVEIVEPEAHLITIRDGLAVRFEMFRDEAEARRAAGLSQ